MLTPETLCRACSDSTRLRCLLLLLGEERLCVCEFSHALAAPQPKVSRHLGHLRDLGIVADERRGQWVHYRLHEDLPDWAGDILAAARRAHSLADLRARLAAMPNRPFAACD